MTNQPPEYPDYGSVPGATPPPSGPPGGSYGPPYQPPPPGYGYAPGGYGPPPRASQKAVWSMILGISSLASVPLCCGLFGLGVAPAIAAIIMGVQSKREIAESGGTLTGAGQAQAGFITGIIGSVLCLLTLAFLIVLIVAS